MGKGSLSRKLLLRFLILALFPVFMGAVALYQARVLKSALSIRTLVQEELISAFYRVNSRVNDYLIKGEGSFNSVQELYAPLEGVFEILRRQLKGEQLELLGPAQEALKEHKGTVSRLVALRREYGLGTEQGRSLGEQVDLALRNNPSLYPILLRAREKGKEFLAFKNERAAQAQREALEQLLANVTEPEVKEVLSQYAQVVTKNNEILKEMTALQGDLGFITLKMETVLTDLLRSVNEKGEKAYALAQRVTLIAVIASFLVAAFIGLITSRRLTRPLLELVGVSEEVAKGNYGVKVELSRDDELGTLAKAMAKMASDLRERAEKERQHMEEVQRQRDLAQRQREEADRLRAEVEANQRELLEEIKEISAFVEETAKGDYSQFLPSERFGQLKALAEVLNQMKRQQREILLQVLEASNQVLLASSQVTEASQSLAMNATNQAAAVQQTTGSMEEISAVIGQNAQKAQEANRFMHKTVEVVKETLKAIQSLIGAMDEIVRASDNTQRIVKTIDEIAFQTNLLALNAAIEAARAGSAGSGFAVVADEIRALAQRSAEAAQQTAQLIDEMVQKVKRGKAILEGATEKFWQMDQESKKISQLMEEIAIASSEQAQGVAEVKAALQQINDMVQQVAANAEESAAAAEEMKSQASTLAEMVAYFHFEGMEGQLEG